MKMLLTVKNMISTDARLLYYRENDASVSKQGITENMSALMRWRRKKWSAFSPA